MLESLVLSHIGSLTRRNGRTLAVVLPGGRRVGPADADVRLRLHSLLPLRHLVSGRLGLLASDCVIGRLDIDGPTRRIADLAAAMLNGDPTRAAPRNWLGELRSRWRHRRRADARQIQHHYDLSDAFYALWLDPRRVYSCAYWPQEASATLAQAQEAKLDLVCRKLMLRPGERFLDLGAGWGGLLLWAAEHYGVRATGITLSRNQHAYVRRLVADKGLEGRVRVHLVDYRDVPEDRPFDKIASIGMFEHVGRAMLPTYFAKIRRLLAPGGLLLNHGITAGGTRNAQLGGGLGDFMERWIFPGGELLHISHVLRVMAEQGLEGLDTENLRPHYARTLWAWSDALEAQLDQACAISGEQRVRAYRLYLMGSAMGFERGWMALHQTLASRPSGRLDGQALRGSQTPYPFRRDYVYTRR